MKLFVDTEYKGHHSEYLEILINSYIKSKNRATFIVNPKFIEERRELLNYENINIQTYIKSVSLIKKIKEVKYIKSIADRFNIDEICLLDFNFFYKVVPLFFDRYKVSGIYFMPYLNKNGIALSESLFKYLYFKLIFIINNITSIYILNDKDTVRKFRLKFNNKKFSYLVDPVFVKEDISISKCDDNQLINFCFLGEISPRKGVFQFLDALGRLKIDELEKISVSFGGNSSIYKKQILLEIAKLEIKNPRLFRDVDLDRISDDKFHSILFNSDVVLCLHQVLEGSSGIVGKASLYSKPIIGPENGLIGELIGKYNLGIQINTSDINQITGAIRETICFNGKKLGGCVGFKQYVDEHSPSNFVETLSRNYK